MNSRHDPDTIRRERTWKLVSTIIGMLGTLLAKKVIRSAYRAIRKDEPATAFDPTSDRFSWPNALLWAVAAGIGLVIAKMVGDRLAAIGWKAATGTAPQARSIESALG